MTEYVSIVEETRNFGKNSYVEVARKRLVDGEGPTDFLLVTRGFYDANGTKKWTRFVTLPAEPEIQEWVVRTLAKL